MAATEEIEKEILAEMAANPVPYAAGQVNDVITIDGETRMISVPASEIFFGVESDKDVERKHFRCPKVVGDGIDLSKHQIYISYITSDSAGKTFSGNAGLYLCEDVATDGDDITFSWQLFGNVFASAGFIAFKVLAAKTDGENVQTRWNTVPAIGTVLMTVPDGMDIGEAYPDIVTQLLERMASVEKIATEEAMQGYVNTYLEAHPGEIDETLTDPKKAAPASVVGELKEDLSNIVKNSDNLFNKSDVVYGKFISTSGVEKDNTKFAYVKIPCEPNTTYTVSGTNYNLIVYNFDDVLVATDTNDNGVNKYTFTTRPVWNGYFILNFKPKIYPVDDYMVVVGESLPDTYTPFAKILNEGLIIGSHSLESFKNELFDKKRITRHIVEVSKAGDKDFSSIVEAVKYAKKYANYCNQYDVIIYDTSTDGHMEGTTFDIIEELGGQSYLNTINSSSYQSGLLLEDYVNLIGVGKVKLVAILPDNATYDQSYAISTIDITGETKLENLTIIAKNCRYCIHDESKNSHPNKTHTFINLRLEHLGNVEGLWQYTHAYACGTSGGCHYQYKDSTFISKDGLPWSMHNNQLQQGITMKIDGCVMQGSINGNVAMKFGFLGKAPISNNPSESEKQYWDCYSDIYIKNVLVDEGKIISVQPEDKSDCTNPYRIHNFTDIPITIIPDNITS